jgi:hypothetical protein
MSRFIFLISGLSLIVLLTACMPAAATQPSGPSAEEIQATIGTTVALTLTASEETRVAAFTSTPTETATPVPSLTPTLFFPTLTPYFTPTQVPPPLAVPTKAAYACAVINKMPVDNSVFKPNKDFDVKFWLRNVGTKRWDKGLDLSYHEGPKMIVGNTIYELSAVEPGEMVGPFIFDAQTPNKAGTHVMTLRLQGGFCYPYVKIVVKK